eukprot:CAMPEP_0174732924 /NCGR_PEP_ID=MMETSP1094-20130205/60298_1 /TAXON_ID=156173 /ORGANISM="Chrysochromulina brevifilum, Strain UTEX LB 985" /LENGTH=129 /DNA_ID=CAMNT_0015935501 /DNA_START=470 /DNA_END=859 /DNA_ORIENTATION=-
MLSPGSSVTADTTDRHARAASAASAGLTGLHGGPYLLGLRIAEVEMHDSSAAQAATRPSFDRPKPLHVTSVYDDVDTVLHLRLTSPVMLAAGVRSGLATPATTRAALRTARRPSSESIFDQPFGTFSCA